MALPIVDAHPILAPREGLQRLAHIPYRHAREGALHTDDCKVWRFSCGGVEGVNMQHCIDENTYYLDNCLEEFLPPTISKVTIRIEISGYECLRTQKNVQSRRGGRYLPTPRLRMARYVGEAVRKFLLQATRTEGHNGIDLCSGEIRPEHLYLLELRQHRRTFEPILGCVLPVASISSVQVGASIYCSSLSAHTPDNSTPTAPPYAPRRDLSEMSPTLSSHGISTSSHGISTSSHGVLPPPIRAPVDAFFLQLLASPNTYEPPLASYNDLTTPWDYDANSFN